MKKLSKKRCAWCGSDPLYVRYHDEEWGVPVVDDHKLFEFLILEGAQAGLSWITILKRREGYRKAFAAFDPDRVARFSKSKIERLLKDPGIVRNRLKVESAVTNAKAFLRVRKEFGSFAKYQWGLVGNKSIQNNFGGTKGLPAQTKLSLSFSKDLKKRGFRFVGPTIIYAYMQAVGMVNDHIVSCYRHNAINKKIDF